MKSFQEIQDILPPLPPNIKRIYLLGSTGAGKTSIVSHIMGTSALGFPITTQTRTTLATTEYVIKSDLPFKTILIFKQKEDVLESIEELIQDAIQKAVGRSSAPSLITLSLLLPSIQPCSISCP